MAVSHSICVGVALPSTAPKAIMAEPAANAASIISGMSITMPLAPPHHTCAVSAGHDQRAGTCCSAALRCKITWLYHMGCVICSACSKAAPRTTAAAALVPKGHPKTP